MSESCNSTGVQLPSAFARMVNGEIGITAVEITLYLIACGFPGLQNLSSILSIENLDVSVVRACAFLIKQSQTSLAYLDSSMLGCLLNKKWSFPISLMHHKSSNVRMPNQMLANDLSAEQAGRGSLGICTKMDTTNLAFSV